MSSPHDLFTPLSEEEYEELDGFFTALVSGPITIPPTSATNDEPFMRPEPRVGHNDPCPCGSGKKHKKCCEPH